jgi:hypothetical protein
MTNPVLLAISKSSPLPAPPAILRKEFSLVELSFEPWMSQRSSIQPAPVTQGELDHISRTVLKLPT